MLKTSSNNAITRDLNAAKDAYEKSDAEASRLAHSSKANHHGTEQHQGATGEYIQAVVFGGLDGIITTFAVVMAAAASKLTYANILILGFANLLADAIGMGVGDYLSSKAESDHAESEKARERWEIENMPEAEKQEMREIYMAKGLSLEEATEVVDILFQSKEAFLDVMMVEELGILVEDDNSADWKGAIITFVSFLVLGGLPMLPYLVNGDFSRVAGADKIFWSSIGVFAFTLYGLGAYKGHITGRPWWLSGFQMIINGSVTSGIAYAIGWAISLINHQ